ncbi:MAG: hypothetical protein KAS93_06325 [Gammaproteobacteria bacterium]|nr:hypothetical protein [Gammaproteobacteria bacterium]
MNSKEILNLKLESDDFDKDLTIGGYFKELLVTLWREGESFSGKRPFGNSGWEYDVYKPLIAAGVIAGKLDEDGYIEDVDNVPADKFIIGLIEAAFDS